MHLKFHIEDFDLEYNSIFRSKILFRFTFPMNNNFIFCLFYLIFLLFLLHFIICYITMHLKFNILYFILKYIDIFCSNY